MNTPAMLVRTALYWLVAQALAIVVIASAAPGGASWLTLAGFVTAYYDENIFALRLVSVPWTDPRVFVSLQTLAQMLAVAMAAAALTTMARTNPWQHGVLPDSTPQGRDSSTRPSSSGGAPPAPGPTAAPLQATAPVGLPLAPPAPMSPGPPPPPLPPSPPPPPPVGPAGL